MQNTDTKKVQMYDIITGSVTKYHTDHLTLYPETDAS